MLSEDSQRTAGTQMGRQKKQKTDILSRRETDRWRKRSCSEYVRMRKEESRKVRTRDLYIYPWTETMLPEQGRPNYAVRRQCRLKLCFYIVP